MNVSAEFARLADQAAAEELRENESSVTKRNIWEAMGNELEIAGYEKTKISQKIHETIEGRLEKKLGYPVQINTAWYYTVMKQNGWQDPSYDRSGQTAPDRELTNSSINTPNADLVRFLFDVIRTAKTMAEKCAKMTDNDGRPMEISDHIPPTSYKKCLTDLKTINGIMRDAVDEKTKVPPNLHHIFHEILQTQSGMYAVAKAFYLARMEMMDHLHGWMTKKQANKFKAGAEPNQLPIFAPKTRDQALFMGWYGQQCNCGSWRVEESSKDGVWGSLSCTDCDTTLKAQTLHRCRSCQIPLYAEDMAKMKKTKKCSECGYQFKIPEELLAETIAR